MKKLALILAVLLAFTMVGCVAQTPPEPTEPSTNPTTAPTTEPPTETPTERLYTLADLDFSNMPVSGGASEKYTSFCYDPDNNYAYLGEKVEKSVTALTPGCVYSMDYETEEFILVVDEAVAALWTTRDYLFCITAENTLIVTDLTGTVRVELYRAEEPLGVKSLGYCRTSLYFIEGSSIMNMDLLTGEIKKLIEYEGVIDADPLYGIDDEFPHLLILETETEDVACNLETGETAVIPETGQWGTAAFELYCGYGIWPETEPPTEEPTEARADIEFFQQLLQYTDGAGKDGYNAALNCTFEKPEDLDLGRFFWSHFDTGERWEDLTDEEVAFLESRGVTNWFGIEKHSAETMDAVLQEHFGLPLSAFQSPSMLYYEETDCYYKNVSSPLILHMFLVTEVEYGEDGIVKVYYFRDAEYLFMGKYVLTLQEKTQGESGYYILSNMPVVYETPRQEGMRLDGVDLDLFEALFEPQVLYAKEPDTYYAMAMCVEFNTPKNLNLLYYFNQGFELAKKEPITEDELNFFLSESGCDRNTIGDVYRLPASWVNGILQYYFGLTAEQVTGWSSEGWVYNPDTDCFYISPPGAMLPGIVDFHDGYCDETSGTFALYYYNTLENGREFVITLQSKSSLNETGYYILSNLPVEKE